MIVDRITRIRDRLCREFAVSSKPLRVRFASRTGGGARTSLAGDANGVSTIVLSSPSVADGILAHEIAHALIPTRWLFCAEGFATWASILVNGDCRDSYFGRRSIEDVMLDFKDELLSLPALFTETIDSRTHFNPARFASLTSRLAHVQGASFLRWLMRERGTDRLPDLARAIASRPHEDPSVWIGYQTDLGIEELEKEWRAAIDVLGKGGPHAFSR